MRLNPALCFKALLAVGLFCLLLSVATYPSVLAHVQLDRVLSPAELQDQAKLQQTLALLEKAAGYQWIFWLLVGLSNLGLSLFGLRSLRAN